MGGQKGRKEQQPTGRETCGTHKRDNENNGKRNVWRRVQQFEQVDGPDRRTATKC